MFSPATLTSSDEAAMIGYADQAQGSNRSFYTHYQVAGGYNGHFDFPVTGDHGWAAWAAQLHALSGDLAAWIK
jgi:S-formylglutathione hydrolase FrmB